MKLEEDKNRRRRSTRPCAYAGGNTGESGCIQFEVLTEKDE
ncbi:hypothetical protein CLOSTMETH_03007 [[Clostridium] methylpentosum DSM 5476]|uniref:Uncharacterized protein n=1 Tax=[Clostridium] methylpentosum DSM 5476 TaxID=537013 RepID=C0EGL4_9FIRM|nr:hypothetical protein CLOSTMETH_03007 [[Clostridium] methylpentosum DSM 5476]